MKKRALSVTLAPENLLWLRGQVRANGRRSVSDVLDRLISDARTRAKATGASRSVVGRVRIDPTDPDLHEADAAVRAVFVPALARPARAAVRPARVRRRRG